MHIAYAVQTPSIVIFGPTCQIKNAPAGKGLALSTDLPCRPCQYTDLLETCQDPCCMKELAPQLVMEKAEQILSRRDKE
jgi:ADP-heptose:LPS heptosyltransferase